MREVYDFLKKSGSYYLATAEGDQPRVRPFATAAIFDGRLYIQTGKVKNVSKQLAANPKIEICAYKDDEWVRIEAVAVNDENAEAKRHMLDEYPDLKDRYDAADGNTQVLYLKDATATFYSLSGKPKVIKF